MAIFKNLLVKGPILENFYASKVSLYTIESLCKFSVTTCLGSALFLDSPLDIWWCDI